MKREVKINQPYGTYNDDGIFIGVNGQFIYKETKVKPTGVIKRCIIHMIPTHDTIDEMGNLNGYKDSLFFTMVIYNLDTMEYYVTTNKDAIWFEVKTTVKAFKDLSTMIVCEEPVTLDIYQAVNVNKAYN